jgi:hypothetical protein
MCQIARKVNLALLTDKLLFASNLFSVEKGSQSSSGTGSDANNLTEDATPAVKK